MDIENIVSERKINDEAKIKAIVKELIDIDSKSLLKDEDDINKQLSIFRKKYHCTISKNSLRYVYTKYFNNGLSTILNRYLIKKAVRSRSGVLVVTVVLKPDQFSCPKKCSYCPTETDLDGKPTQPKSYLSTEPAMLRALQYDFDITGQVWDRIRSYINTGNIDDIDGPTSYKMEFILSGGTWESYSFSYRNQVINEIYGACNTFIPNNRNKNNVRIYNNLETEININETAKYRIIGLTLETRPDFVTKHSIKLYRQYGVTRIQLGVQHTNDNILDSINRECHTNDAIKAIKLLKSAGFKVVCHLMPDLPNSSPELDKEMFDKVISDPDLQFDDVKVYPTAVCISPTKDRIVSSDIIEWYNKGIYKPYAESNIEKLIDVLIHYKEKIQPWVRIQRLVRDIPSKSILSGYDKVTNLRQIVQDKMTKQGKKCYCIRCMEIGWRDELVDKARLVVRPYEASGGKEFHISYEAHNVKWFYKIYMMFYMFIFKIFYGKQIFWFYPLSTYEGLMGFCRLRLESNPGIDGYIHELKNCALIREVHVYGSAQGIGSKNQIKTQHKGFGQKLVKTAEIIAKQNGYNKIAIIAGTGTREYYKNKLNYHLDGTYMVKTLDNNNYSKKIFYYLLFFLIIFYIIFHYFF